MRWIVLGVWLLISPSVQAATVTVHDPLQVEDSRAEWLLNKACVWFHCGEGTQTERVQVLLERLGVQGRVSVEWQEPSRDGVRDADGQGL